MNDDDVDVVSLARLVLLLLVLVFLLLTLERAMKKVGTEGLDAVSVLRLNLPMAVIRLLKFAASFCCLSASFACTLEDSQRVRVAVAG